MYVSNISIFLTASPIGRAVKGLVLRPIACRDYGFESHWEAWMSIVIVVCCQLMVSATS